MPNIFLRIRPTILVLFMFLTLLILISTFVIQYYSHIRIVDDTLDRRIEYTSNNIYREIINFDSEVKNNIKMMEIFNDIGLKLQAQEFHPILTKMAYLILNNPYIYSMHIGYENGEFLELIDLNMDSSLQKKYKTNSNEQWLAVKIFKKDGINTRFNTILDHELKPTREYSEQTDYNPTKRLWYIHAQSEDRIIRSELYKYEHMNFYGVTYAKAVKDKGLTIGIDVSTKAMTDFLKVQKNRYNTKLFLLDNSNNNILISSEEYINRNLLELLEKNILREKNKIKLDNESYFISSSLIPGKYFSQKLIILTPIKDMMESFKDTIILEIIGNMFLLLFILPLVYYLASLISSPVLKLKIENEKIKNKNYGDVVIVKTRIKELHELTLSLVSMSRNIKSYYEDLENLIDSFVNLIANTIDAKSLHTGFHCRKVPIILMKLVEEASKKEEGFFKNFSMKSKEKLREISIAANLHDCGKIITPEYVIDKAVKLETFYNRIHEIRTRFEVIYRDLKIKSLEDILNGKDKNEVEITLKNELNKLQEEFAFIASCNMGTEFMKDEDKQRVKEIAKKEWIRYFDDSLGLSNDERLRYVENSSSIEKLLDDKPNHLIKRENFNLEEYNKLGFKLEVPQYLYNDGEIYNLCIERGTINKEERFKINEHIIMTIKMLSSLPFPENLKNVVEYAGNHHETLIGTGYPRKLTKNEMSIPSRMMALADVFEALTANDRPYKAAKKLSKTIKILISMVQEGHLDEDVFQLFIESKIYLNYAKEYLLPEQLDLEATEEILSDYKNNNEKFF